jgi:hypothetical protein
MRQKQNKGNKLWYNELGKTRRELEYVGKSSVYHFCSFPLVQSSSWIIQVANIPFEAKHPTSHLHTQYKI